MLERARSCVLFTFQFRGSLNSFFFEDGAVSCRLSEYLNVVLIIVKYINSSNG